MFLNPAEYVIKIFGGVRATAREVERTPSAISGWRKVKRVPLGMFKRIQRRAKARKKTVTLDNLILGGEYK